MKLILASASPRRLEILRSHGIDPVVMPTDTDETLPDGIDPEDAVRMLASRKAHACYNYNIKGDRIEAHIVSDQLWGHAILAADTIVWKDEIMGKPSSPEDAFRMLDKIRGTSHKVITGVSIIDVDTGEETVLADTTLVHCTAYTDDDIYRYLSTEEPYDKAGAYAIQGYFGRYIDHIDGSYDNVVGLPYDRISKLLEPYL